MSFKLSRRKFITALVTLTSSIGLLWLRRLLKPFGVQAQQPTNQWFLPFVAQLGNPIPTTPASFSTQGHVIHLYSTQATSWDFGSNYYGNYVNQNVVNAMVDRGVRELVGASSVAQAWQTLVPNYAPGKAIAIKVNFNNWRWCDHCSTNCSDWQLKIDALIHPINAVIRGLMEAYPAFRPSDIWVYDATKGATDIEPREIHDVFKNGCLYNGVRYFAHQSCSEFAGYTSTDPTGAITWHNPPGIPTPPAMRVTDVLVNATYVINIPIIKTHGGSGATLGFKNHFGSLSNVEPLHNYVYYPAPYFSSTYSPLVDLYRNPHIMNKTVLVIGDGLFGNWYDNVSKPVRWTTFGNAAPNSLFFAQDPVAIDCVMCDILAAETTVGAWADDYLQIANNVGLGIYERGNPWLPNGTGYQTIHYQKIAL